jgi:Tfp pilus assembly protein PilX
MNPRSSHHAAAGRQEEGASLVLVLVFLSLFGLFVGALLGQSDTSIRASAVTDEQQSRVQSADDGIQYGIQQVQNNDSLCPTSGGGAQTLTPLHVNGRLVTVTCQAVGAGDANGVSGYAVITHATDGSSLSASGGNTAKQIGGPVFLNGGMGGSEGINVTRGSITQVDNSSACTVGATTQANMAFQSPPYTYSCVASAGTALPDPNPQPPTTGVPATAALALDSPATHCKIFYPGRYTAPPVLDTANYFYSGVYYFDFSGVLDIKQETVVGGRPSAFESNYQVQPVPSCRPSSATGTDGRVTGVDILLGQGATVDVDTQGALELFAVAGADSNTTGYSLTAVPGTWAGWDASTVAAGTQILQVSDGNTGQLTMHGFVYAPQADSTLFATNSSVAEILGGIDVDHLSIQSSASASNAAISTQAGPGTRQLLIKAVAGTSGTEGCDAAAAVVDIGNDSNRTANIDSWRDYAIPLGSC